MRIGFVQFFFVVVVLVTSHICACCQFRWLICQTLWKTHKTNFQSIRKIRRLHQQQPKTEFAKCVTNVREKEKKVLGGLKTMKIAYNLRLFMNIPWQLHHITWHGVAWHDICDSCTSLLSAACFIGRAASMRSDHPLDKLSNSFCRQANESQPGGYWKWKSMQSIPVAANHCQQHSLTKSHLDKRASEWVRVRKERKVSNKNLTTAWV